ncbi:unnamed protein product [Didymodactylos carnosus]|nr:unnamed protein product [Didymodactylos carnosus]CAF3666821.1 unnamed protein product [Didymodactylos carnosus]
MIILPIGGSIEIIGWAARIWSSQDSLNNNAFLAQTVTLIIAPAFFSAANYVILGKMIPIIGSQYSRLSAWTYTIIFVICDVISLVIQAIGGGMAAVAENMSTSTDLGTHIMVGGIVFQMASMALYVLFGLEFAWRATKKRPFKKRIATDTPAFDRAPLSLGKYKGLIFAMFLSTLMIFIRSIYRTIELLQGWTGYVITHEPFFDCLDGVPMIIAIAIFTFFHPMRYFTKADTISGAVPKEDITVGGSPVGSLVLNGQRNEKGNGPASGSVGMSAQSKPKNASAASSVLNGFR